MTIPIKTLHILRLLSSFPFAIFYSSMVLLLANKYHLTSTNAATIVGCFLGLNYGLAVLGGCLAGKHVSYRGLFVWSMILQGVGCGFLLAPTLNAALIFSAIFLTGSLGSTVSINLLLTQYFSSSDIKRESAFFGNYCAMNISYFLAYLLSGWLLFQNQSYSILLAVVAIILTLSLGLTCLNFYKLADLKSAYQSKPNNQKYLSNLITAGLFCIVVAISFLALKYAFIFSQLIIVLWVLSLAAIIFIAIKNHQYLHNFFSFMIYYLSGVLFWAVYLLAPLALMLFLKEMVNLHIGNVDIAPQWVQNINTFIIVFGTAITPYLLKNESIQKRFSLPLFFASAVGFMGLGFFILFLGTLLATHKVNLIWVVLNYISQSIGEIFIGPVGYALVGRIIPHHHQGVFSGLWILLLGIAAIISGNLSQHFLHTSGHLSMNTFQGGFLYIALFCIAISIVLILLRPYLNRVQHVVETE